MRLLLAFVLLPAPIQLDESQAGSLLVAQDANSVSEKPSAVIFGKLAAGSSLSTCRNLELFSLVSRFAKEETTSFYWRFYSGLDTHIYTVPDRFRGLEIHNSLRLLTK